jgi:hypothetical protein
MAQPVIAFQLTANHLIGAALLARRGIEGVCLVLRPASVSTLTPFHSGHLLLLLFLLLLL